MCYSQKYCHVAFSARILLLMMRFPSREINVEDLISLIIATVADPQMLWVIGLMALLQVVVRRPLGPPTRTYPTFVPGWMSDSPRRKS